MGCIPRLLYLFLPVFALEIYFQFALQKCFQKSIPWNTVPKCSEIKGFCSQMPVGECWVLCFPLRDSLYTLIHFRLREIHQGRVLFIIV